MNLTPEEAAALEKALADLAAALQKFAENLEQEAANNGDTLRN